MTNAILVKDGTQFLFADHASDFGAAPATATNSLIIGAVTDVQINLTGIVASGGARQSAKSGDLGATRADRYSVDACLEFEAPPADGGAVYFYWAPSPSATVGQGNPGGTTGSDAAFIDTVGNLGQMQRIGVLILKNTVINIGFVGVFSPIFRYGMLVVVNQGSTALKSTATAMAETHIVMTPIIDEIQNAT
jgi:hypothetical protein